MNKIRLALKERERSPYILVAKKKNIAMKNITKNDDLSRRKRCFRDNKRPFYNTRISSGRYPLRMRHSCG